MNYFIPSSIEQAIALISSEAEAGRGARFVAGGTDLAVQIADGIHAPDALVDLAGIRELQGISRNREGFSIGAAVTIEELARREDLPACLVQGARAIGSPQIRSLGTVGGNLCNASPCGDTLAPVIVLEGRFVLAGPGGRREVPAEEFFTGPKATVLKPAEILVEVLFGPQALEGSSAFRMIGKRNGQAISQVNVAVWLRKGRGGAIAEVRAAAGSVAPTPIRLRKAEEALRGRRLTEELLRKAADQAADEIRPISDVRASAEYRRTVTAALFREALAEAYGGER